MPVSTRPIVQLGIVAGAVIAACCAGAAALGCFGSRGAAPGRQPIVEEMPPAESTMTALPQQCDGLPVLAGVVADKDAGAGDQEGAAVQRVPVWVQASSLISTARGVSSLFDPDPESYWHIDIRKKLPLEWATFDFSADAAVAGLQVRPRLDEPGQLFTTACLLGSGDREHWKGIAQLTIERVSTPRWISWRLTAPQSFRSYRIAIPNGDHTFYSVGKARFLASDDFRS